MKQPLKENGGLPASILWTLAIVAGISVANIYYVQPLLNMIRHELGISEFRTNLIAMVTQIGYAAGLLFITPLGDLYQRKKIILANFLVLIFSLLTIALAHNIHVILVASFLTGACSMIPQIFIPMAAQFSRPEHKGRNVGIVLSGLLTGILASRVVSGFVGELFGWREMYYIAAGMMFVCAVVVLKVLPNMQPKLPGKVQRPDEIPAGFGERVSATTHLLYPGRPELRFAPRHVVLPRFQNGTSSILRQ